MSLPENHPLAEKVLALAREKGIDIQSYEGMRNLLLQLGHDKLDPRSLLILSELVEHFSRYDKMIEAESSESKEGEVSGSGLDLKL